MGELVRTNRERAYSSAILTPELQVTDGLVSYWPMLKNQGTTLFDRYGSNNGTINGATWDNGALDFDGVDDYVDITGSYPSSKDSVLTASCWIYTNDLNDRRIMQFRNNYDVILTINSSGELQANTWDGSNAYIITTNININTWYHVTVICGGDGGNLSLYVDGSLINTITCYIKESSQNSTYIGADWDLNELWNGKIDEVRIYDKALSSTEIQTIYNRGRKTHNQRTLIPVNTDGLVGYWPITQGSGGTAYDESKNGNDGTINGAVWADTVNGKALDFDGTDDCVEITDLWSSMPSRFSFSGWVYLEDISAGNIFEAMTDDGTFGVDFDHGGNDKFRAYCNDDGGWPSQYSTSPYSSGSWHHLVGIWRNNNNVELFVDGTSQGTTSISSIQTGTRRNEIGTNGRQNNYITAKIDEVRIYNKALSAQEITNIYEKTRGLYGV